MRPYLNGIVIGKFLKIILALQLSAIGFIGFDYIGIEIPILREVFCFIYLAFIPGILILGILRLDRLNMIETVLYSLGLSCSFLMFVGLFMNEVYPVFGITKPLSTTSLITTLIALISALYLLCCIRNPGYIPSSIVNLNTDLLFSPYTLSFLLIPFLAIFGSYSVCFYDNNILLLLLLLLIAVIPIFVAFDKIPSETYPLLGFVIAISLLCHNDFSSMYIQGSDLHLEYYFANLVKSNSYWNLSTPHTYNTALSIVMLAPIFSDICGMSLTWVFKLIYPFIFSLVPLALYKVYKEQTNEKTAFLSCFFFMSIRVFYIGMLQWGKQMVAIFFLSILILSMMDKQLNNTKRTMLSLIFAFSLIVSHYSTSYIFLFSLVFVYLLILLGRKLNKITDTSVVTSNFVVLLIVSALVWYMYTARSSAFNSAVHIGTHVIGSISEIFSPIEGGAVFWLTRKLFPSEQVLRFLYFISVFLIIVGFSDALYQNLKKRWKNNWRIEYLLFSTAFIGLLIISIILPFIAARGSIGFDRVFFISSIFLAIFCIIGGIKVEKSLTGVFYKSIASNLLSSKSLTKGISIFLVAFFLLNCSFVSEIIQEITGGDRAISPSISKPRIEKTGDINEKIAYYGFSYPTQDVVSATWLGIHKTSSEIFLDSYNSAHVLISYGMVWEDMPKINPTNQIKAISHYNAYIFLRKINYIDNIMQVDYWTQKATRYERNWWNTSEILPILEEKRNKIYSNGEAVIYK